MAIYEQATIMAVFNQTDLPNGIKNLGDSITILDPIASTLEGFQEAFYNDAGVLGAMVNTKAEEMVFNEENKTVGYIGYGNVVKAISDTALYLITFTRPVPPADLGFGEGGVDRAGLIERYSP